MSVRYRLDIVEESWTQEAGPDCSDCLLMVLPFLINDFQGCPGKGKRHIQGFYELNLKYHDSPLVKLSDTATSNLRLDYEPKKRR